MSGAVSTIKPIAISRSVVLYPYLAGKGLMLKGITIPDASSRTCDESKGHSFAGNLPLINKGRIA